MKGLKMPELQRQNPFIHDYVFSEKDISRARISVPLWTRIKLWFKHTYVQIDENYVWYYKHGTDGAIYLLKVHLLISDGENLLTSKKNERL
jgi:hypothetical protein